MPTFPTVTAYLAAQPPAARKVLARVRATIRKALPDAEESITYQMPTYKLDGTAVIFFAGWKSFFSIYPVDAALAKKLGSALDGYEVNQKGTLRVPYAGDVPVALITRIARLRAGAR
jgi:uncharacterized protein YdhG (YjbR/CyaY superfamily)